MIVQVTQQSLTLVSKAYVSEKEGDTILSRPCGPMGLSSRVRLSRHPDPMGCGLISYRVTRSAAYAVAACNVKCAVKGTDALTGDVVRMSNCRGYLVALSSDMYPLSEGAGYASDQTTTGRANPCRTVY